MIAPINEKELRKDIIQLINDYENIITKTKEENDEVMEAYFMGKQTALTELLTKINNI